MNTSHVNWIGCSAWVGDRVRKTTYRDSPGCFTMCLSNFSFLYTYYITIATISITLCTSYGCGHAPTVHPCSIVCRHIIIIIIIALPLTWSASIIRLSYYLRRLCWIINMHGQDKSFNHERRYAKRRTFKLILYKCGSKWVVSHKN